MAKPKWVVREFIAVVFWGYILLKLAVFDIDVYVLDHFAPNLRWVLDLKVFFLMAMLGVLLRGSAFYASFAYIALYPFIVLLWKVPKFALRRWSLAIAFTPAIYRLAATVRTTFSIYALGTCSTLLIVYGSRPELLLPAIFGLSLFLVFHLYRSLRKAYGNGAFAAMASGVRKLRENVQEGAFDGRPMQGVSVPEGSLNPDPSVLYWLRQLADVVDLRVRKAARSRKYDVCLMIGWLYTVLVTISVFALEYFALDKLDPLSFKFAQGANFWAFLGFSMGVLTPAKASAIMPASRTATLFYYSEAGCSLLVLIVLVFTVLTAARETFRDDVDAFGAELKFIAEAIDTRVTQVFSMNIPEVEIVLIPKHLVSINLLRKARWLPDLQLPVPKNDSTDEPKPRL
jgi:hypothetical protein